MPLLTISLEPNQQLLKSEFEGYKLNLQTLPHIEHELEVPVDRVFTDGVHAKIFGPHNHLIHDPWGQPFGYYYIDNQHRLHHLAYDGGHNFQNRVVYKMPIQSERESGFCLLFADINIAVISSALGYLHVVDTGNRTKQFGGKKNWQTISSFLPLGDTKSIVIIDCKIQETDCNEQLHCLVQSVERNDVNYNSVLNWIIYKQEDDRRSWKQISLVDFKSKGKVNYAALESNCEAVYIATDSPLQISKLTETLEQRINHGEAEKMQCGNFTENDSLDSESQTDTSMQIIRKDSKETIIIQKLYDNEEVSAIVRLDANTLQITHRIPLSKQQYLFKLHLENYESPALVLRHDMDACIWQPYAKEAELWTVKHQATLMSFGYIQTSKHQYKFSTCAPNFSYTVICDGKKHIFMYVSDNNPVENKTTKATMKQLEQEHIFNMDQFGEVLGVHATNHNLFVLTKNYFIAIRII